MSLGRPGIGSSSKLHPEVRRRGELGSIHPVLYSEERIVEADDKSEEQNDLSSEPFCPKWVLH